MKTPILLTVCFLAAALSGCMGGDSGHPQALFTITPKDAQRQTFTFDASGSSGGSLAYKWDFGDGTSAEGKTVEHTYEYVNGEYQATLTVTNGDGKSELTLTVVTGTAQNQSPILCLRVDTRRVAPGADVVFDASTSSDPDGEPLTFDWDFNYQDPTGAKFEFEDLGHMQYGHSSSPCPIGTGTDQPGSGMSRSSDEASPLDDTVPGLLPATRDAGHGSSEPHEEYNVGFDGTIESHDPIQVFQFPSPAVYYVLVKALDPKRDAATGFIRIMVEENAPEPFATSEHAATLHYGTEQVPPLDQVPANKTDSWAFKMDYPGALVVTVAFVAENQQPELEVYLCPKGQSAADCKATPTKKASKAQSPIQLSHTFVSPAPGTYQILVENVSPSVNVEVSETLVQTYDTNPWYGTESGAGGGHAGH